MLKISASFVFIFLSLTRGSLFLYSRFLKFLHNCFIHCGEIFLCFPRHVEKGRGGDCLVFPEIFLNFSSFGPLFHFFHMDFPDLHRSFPQLWKSLWITFPDL